MRAFICEKDNCDGVERFCFRYLLLIITLIRVYLVSLVMLTVEKNKTKKKNTDFENGNTKSYAML